MDGFLQEPPPEVDLREDEDELWGQQLWPQSSDLSHVPQEPQHVSVKLLLVWKLLQRDHTSVTLEQQSHQEDQGLH